MAHVGQWLLIELLVVPLAGAVTLVFLRRSRAVWWVTFSCMLLAFVLALLLIIPLNEDVKLFRFHLRADSLSRPFLLLVTAIHMVLYGVSGKAHARPLRFAAQLLLSEFVTIGAFIAFNALLLALFLAAVVVAFSALAGTERRGDRPALALPVFLSIGLCCILGSMIARGPERGTFDLAVPMAAPQHLGSSSFILCVIGCCFWLAIVPMHIWPDQVLTRSSTPAAIVTGVLAPAIGGYALFRLAGLLFPWAYQATWAPLAMLGVASILYGSFCALAQQDLKRFVAFSMSSISGFVLLGFAIRTSLGAAGALMLLMGQGLVVTLLLYLSELPPRDSAALAAVAWIGWLVAPVMLGQLVALLGVLQTANTTSPAYGLATAASFGLFLSGAGAARVCYHLLVPQS